MCNSGEIYAVEWSPYAHRHFKKKFIKTYHSNWGPTEASINALLAHMPFPVLPDTAYVISCDEQGFIAKVEFAVEGINQSAKGSGNRAIVWGSYATRTITVLLIYSKNDAPPSKETVWWKRIIKAEFPDDGGRYC